MCTKRLYIREFRPDDIDALHKIQSNENVMRYITGKAKTYEETLAELHKITSNDSDDFCVYAVVLTSSNELIGTCGIIKDDNDQYEIGYRFGEEHFGKGYGTELLNWLINYCLNVRNCPVISAVVEEKNIYSVKMLDNSSMNRVRTYTNDGITEIEYALSLSECLKA